MRQFRKFTYKDTNLRISSDLFDVITDAVVTGRKELERYIRCHPEFKTSLVPVRLLSDAPDIAVKMAAAAQKTGIGPMASVAGALAELGAKAAIYRGACEAIVENGGDMYIYSDTEVIVGIYAGEGALSELSFNITTDVMPVAICSSSSKMGHSLSMGNCDLVTVISKNAALADSLATAVCNKIRHEDELASVLEQAGRSINGLIDEKRNAKTGVNGILAVKNRKIALWGNLPPIIKNSDPSLKNKITKDLRSTLK